MEFESIIGLEIHAELMTKSKMFCSCPVIDVITAEANSAVCPVCSGMPGVLPVINEQAVTYGLRVALALNCEISPISVFARKNYFYPDLPKGYQISQYELPLARNGQVRFASSDCERTVRIRRVHLEEDTGKLTHIPHSSSNQTAHSLVDLNRAGIPLLEIVTEPDFRSAEEVRLFAASLRSILRYLRVNSGDMQKGVLRIEPNVSVRKVGDTTLGTRTEIKNLNSFRALERSIDYEIQRQIKLVQESSPVFQETRGWDEIKEITFTQRRKEEEDDYRYFPEPDLPPLVLGREQIDQELNNLPELPLARLHRFQEQYSLSNYDAQILTEEQEIADYFENAARVYTGIKPKTIANWVTGDLFSLMNKSGSGIQDIPIKPGELAELIKYVEDSVINQKTGREILAEIFSSGQTPEEVINSRNLSQISDDALIRSYVNKVITENPEELAAYYAGKDTIFQWFFGQVMRLSQGKANPKLVQKELKNHLEETRNQE